MTSIRKAILTISFDDSYKDTLKYTLPLLKKYKLRATYNIIAGLIGKKYNNLDIASQKDIENAFKAEMEIASHSLTHNQLVYENKICKFLRSFPQKHNKLRYVLKGFLYTITHNHKINQLSQDKTLIKKEIVDSQKILKDFDADIQSFVYPGGNYDDNLKKLVSIHYSSARTTDAGLNTFEKKNLYSLKTIMWNRWTTVRRMNQYINRAIKENKWLIETFHLVGNKNESNYEYFTSVFDFENHLKYIKQSKIVVAPQKAIAKYINQYE